MISIMFTHNNLSMNSEQKIIIEQENLLILEDCIPTFFKYVKHYNCGFGKTQGVVKGT